MTTYDGEGMCPNIKAHYICCDGDGILLQARIQILRGFDHNYFGYLSSVIVKS